MGLGCLAYDSQFRQQAAAGAPIPWSELNLSLMVATVFNGGGRLPPRHAHCAWPQTTQHQSVLWPHWITADPPPNRPRPFALLHGQNPTAFRRRSAGGLTGAPAHHPPAGSSTYVHRVRNPATQALSARKGPARVRLQNLWPSTQKLASPDRHGLPSGITLIIYWHVCSHVWLVVSLLYANSDLRITFVWL